MENIAADFDVNTVPILVNYPALKVGDCKEKPISQADQGER
jgi:hypothetical protein